MDGEEFFLKTAAAWIGLVGSAAVSLVALVSSLLSQRASRRSQRELETLKAELGERQAEKNARRDYEYEARKRLYEECEPIMFHLYESSFSGMKRVRSLARTAREGDLGPEKVSWLSSEGYYTLSTVYMLTAPLTAFKLIQRRLTLVDLSVDPQVRTLYLLAKQLYLSFTADFKLAREEPAVEYRPNVTDWEVKRRQSPAVYWAQGLPVGRLDNAVGSLITCDAGGAYRCMSFGEFETAYEDRGSSLRANYKPVLDLFRGFHPAQRPVLWRVLVTQLHLYRVLIRIGESGYKGEPGGRALLATGGPVGASPFEIPPAERKEFDWRQRSDEAGDDEVLVHPFRVAEAYLAAALKEQPMR